MITREDLPYLIKQYVQPRFLKPYLLGLTSFEDQQKLIQWLDQVQNVSYKRSILRLYLQHFEPLGISLIDECIYEKYGSLVMQNEADDLDQVLVTYSGPGCHNYSIKIYEQPNVIYREGTTGNRTWEAGIALASYFVDSPHVIGKNDLVVELGAGTGLVGMVLAKLGHRVLLTDGDNGVVENLNGLIELNGLTGLAEAQQLVWGNAAHTNAARSGDLDHTRWMVGADITYDSSYFDNLALTLKEAVPFVIISCTIRSATTHQALKDACSTKGIAIEALKSYPQGGGLFSMGFISPESPEIVVYKLVHKQ